MDLTPKCNCKYGAPMGRQSWNDNHGEYIGKMYLKRIPLNSGGYDSGGAYWGTGMPLYGYAAYDDSINGFVRAYNREDAKARVKAKYPGAVFFR